MRKIVLAIFSLCFCGWLVGARADTLQLTDGTSLTGDVVTFNDNGLMLHMADDKYSDRIPWTKFTQDSLKQLAKNPKIKPLVDPFIEIEPASMAKKEEIQIQDVSRLELPGRTSVIGGLFSSSVGLFLLGLIYIANIYAGFEIAVVRARPIAVVMGVAAVLPIVGPIIFLSMPVKIQASAAEIQSQADPNLTVPGQQPAEEIKIGAGSWQVASAAPAAGHAETQVFQRGQFMFNRRFFETKFSGFFSVVHSGPDKDMTLMIKTGGNWLAVERITRIAANDAHFEVVNGAARQEVMVPFADIQEIQLKPKAA